MFKGQHSKIIILKEKKYAIFNFWKGFKKIRRKN